MLLTLCNPPLGRRGPPPAVLPSCAATAKDINHSIILRTRQLPALQQTSTEEGAGVKAGSSSSTIPTSDDGQAMAATVTAVVAPGSISGPGADVSMGGDGVTAVPSAGMAPPPPRPGPATAALFLDESLSSFFRRPAWSPDGE